MTKALVIILTLVMVFSCKHEPKVPPALIPVPEDNTTDTIRYLALGDSYTIGEAVSLTERWPVQLEHAIKSSLKDTVFLKIVARTGWTSDELQAQLDLLNLPDTFDLVSVLIGVNNQFRGRLVSSFIPEFAALIEEAIFYAQNDTDKVFVVSIPDYGYTPQGQSNQPNISLGIDTYNAASDSVCLEYGVTYINITDISRSGLADASLVASDGLHPSGPQYSQWVSRIAPIVFNKIP
ncbi:MAG TPA: lysophospholipase [Flavobacteriales bacterium]|jgi:lysophospholipase L1-like esterase|nr:lysophospholipase [Flavobacteriales bacterium]